MEGGSFCVVVVVGKKPKGAQLLLDQRVEMFLEGMPHRRFSTTNIHRHRNPVGFSIPSLFFWIASHHHHPFIGINSWVVRGKMVESTRKTGSIPDTPWDCHLCLVDWGWLTRGPWGGQSGLPRPVEASLLAPIWCVLSGRIPQPPLIRCSNDME